MDWQTVTIEQIAERAEIGKGTIYKHFKTKDEILYRQNGWYIGRCAIESANKYIIAQRLKLSGMQWTLHNADAMGTVQIF